MKWLYATWLLLLFRSSFGMESSITTNSTKLPTHITCNLNQVIDVNYYPIVEARNSNMRHRPIGIGVQGLADAFLKMRFPFDSDQAKELNREIFETIYFAALTASKDLAIRDGPYSTFKGSPVSLAYPSV